MDCAALIDARPAPLRADCTLAAAAAALAQAPFQSLPVVNAADEYVGVFGIREVLALIVPRIALAGDMAANLRFLADDPDALGARFAALAGHCVGDWCNRQAAFVRPEDPAIEAVRLFCRGHGILPVVGRDGKVLGLLSPAAAIRVISAPSGRA